MAKKVKEEKPETYNIPMRKWMIDREKELKAKQDAKKQN